MAYILLIGVCVTSCGIVDRNRQADAVVKVGNVVLTQQQLDEITRHATTAEDSAAMAEEYIRQWAGDVLFYEKASSRKNSEIETLVEQYRRNLYLHAYEERLVAQKMDKKVHPDSVAAFYEQHKDMFVLSHCLVKGVLLVVPNGAPDMAKLRKWLKKPDEEIEKIEKYAYQYATGYELFTDNWRTGQQIMLRMPIEPQALTDALRKETQIEVQDSLQTYILEVTDKHLTGEAMPLDYATIEIEKILLNERQMEFLRRQRDDLYEDAKRTFKLHIEDK